MTGVAATVAARMLTTRDEERRMLKVNNGNAGRQRVKIYSKENVRCKIKE
jgi:hypothetical protein